MSSENARSRPGRRRTRSVGSIPYAWRCADIRPCSNHSDEICSSSTSKDVDYSNFYPSDSDVCDEYESYRAIRNLANASTEYERASCKIESDSFNENSPLRQSARRKRKFKKIALDVEMSANHPHVAGVSQYQKKKRIIRIPRDIRIGRLWLNTGKRKRSLREKLQPFADGIESNSLNRESKVLGISKLSLNDYPEERSSAMEVSYTISSVSSSSISSSGSETGIFTNDEGREGDDEQSDWICEIGLASTDIIKDKRSRGSDSFLTYEAFLNEIEPSNREENEPFDLVLPKTEKTKETSIRVVRKKSRTVKPNFDFARYSCGEKNNAAVSDFQDYNFKRKNEVDLETKVAARRHTFGSYKRRKRFAQPQQPCFSGDQISENFSTSYLPVIQQIADITSSDSKDSMQ